MNEKEKSGQCVRGTRGGVMCTYRSRRALLKIKKKQQPVRADWMDWMARTDERAKSRVLAEANFEFDGYDYDCEFKKATTHPTWVAGTSS